MSRPFLNLVLLCILAIQTSGIFSRCREAVRIAAFEKRKKSWVVLQINTRGNACDWLESVREAFKKAKFWAARCQSCSRGPINSARTHSAFVYDAEWRVHCAKNCVCHRARTLRTAGQCALDWIWQYCGGGWSWLDEEGEWVGERRWVVLCRVEWAGPTTWQIGWALVAYQAAAASAHLILLTKQHSGPNNALCPRASQLSWMISQHEVDGLSNSMRTNTSSH
jgi:hypothetical protein